MDWIFHHLQVVVIITVMIASMLKKKHPPVKSSPAPMLDAELAGRTQRVQEEIRRKIAARRTDSPVAVPTPPPERPRVETPPPLVEEFDAGAAQVMREDEELARQRALAQQITDLRTAVRQVDRQANMVEALSLAPAANSLRASVLADLRNPASTRRALLLREILGEPVGLR
jgi:hypothetical protein